MDLDLFARSLFVGLAIAAPVGPIGLLCIRRTLNDGWAIGIAIGLGAATADTAYGAVAAFGLASVIGWIGAGDLVLRMAGGLALVVIGLRTVQREVATSTSDLPSRALLRAYGSAVILTLANPATVISFVGIVAGLGIEGSSPGSASIVVAGIAVGSAAWWLILTSAMVALRNRVSRSSLRWVNRVAGGLLIIFGLLIAVSALD